jgi:hypothetical protein
MSSSLIKGSQFMISSRQLNLRELGVMISTGQSFLKR